MRKNADNTERAEQAVDTTVCFYTPAKNTPPHRERKRFSIENHALWERSTTFDNSDYQNLLKFERFSTLLKREGNIVKNEV